MKRYQEIINTFNNKEDYKISFFKKEEINISVIFLQGMADLKFFISYLYQFIDSKSLSELQKIIPGFCSPLSDYSIDNISYLLSLGNLILILELNNEYFYYHLPLNIIPKRNPAESHLDPSNLFQSRDGLVEDAKDNLLLIKKRIKDPGLIIKRFNLGTSSKTDVYMLYLEKYKHSKYVEEIDTKLLNFKTDNVTNINTITKLFNQNSLIPLANASGNTEYLVENIIKGKVILLVDGNCVGIILPSLFTNFTTAKDEIDSPKYYSIFNRILIAVCLFFAVFFLGLFVALCNYHSNVFSLRVLALIKLTETGTILPMFFEICLILFAFEVYNSAISRSPLGYVQNIVVLFGGLIVGQNIVSSGIVGPFVLLISSICYIAGYSVSNNPRFLISISIFRFCILFGSFCLGLLGFILTSFIIIYYLFHLKSVGVSYLSPFMPTNINKSLNYFTPKD